MGLAGYQPSCRFSERLCICYISVAMMKHHDQRQLKEERFGLMVPKGGEATTAGRRGSRAES